MGKLVCIGDSWTDDNFKSRLVDEDNYPKWPKLVADRLNMNLLNLGSSGSGNHEIFTKFTDLINETKDIDGIIIMWSEPDRVDLEVHKGYKLSSYNKVTDSGFYHYSPRRSAGNKNSPIEKYLDRLTDEQIEKNEYVGRNNFMLNVARTYHNKQDPISQTILDMGIWSLETSWKQTMRYMFLVQSMCKGLDIKYLQVQGIHPFFTWQREQDYKKSLHSFLKWFQEQSYIYSIDETTFLGWPIFQEIGGFSMSHNIEKISDRDTHPNSVGHKEIANHLINKWNSMY